MYSTLLKGQYIANEFLFINDTTFSTAILFWIEEFNELADRYNISRSLY